MYWDPATMQHKEILSAVKADKGDKGDPGIQGLPGGMGALDALSDVTAPASTPVGKVLGTTATGLWGPITPPATGLDVAAGDARYVKLSGYDTIAGGLNIDGTLTVDAITAITMHSNSGLDAQGKITNMAAPTVGLDGANKTYVDSRIWSGTQAQYDAIVTKDPTVLYVVVG